MLRMSDLIEKKRDGFLLNKDEIDFMVSGYTTGSIPDYQMSAMLMAIYFNGMTDAELSDFTTAITATGEIVDLSAIDGVKVDKHSTGGVGDKTTLIITPIVAACGIKVAKMSGRGLGHTGGTADKLESITGYKTELTREELFDIVSSVGACVVAQSGDLAPADKKMYALRDVTGTVESIPLIAASIMSKKLAAGSDCILLDVKVGSGAFMKTLADGVLLAQKMVAIGDKAGKKTVAIITDMDVPLGGAIGNSLEVIEAVEILSGGGNANLRELCLILASNMLFIAGVGALESCKALCLDAIDSGSAYAKFIEMVTAQGGSPQMIKDTSLFAKARCEVPIMALENGYISSINTQSCGTAAAILGAGRIVKDGKIDFAAGIIISKTVGDYACKGEALATLHTEREESIHDAAALLQAAITIAPVAPCKHSLVLARVESGGVLYADQL